MKKHYATALSNKNLDCDFPETSYSIKSINGNVVCVHNIHDGYNKVFDPCDILYSEPAWKHGYNKFMSKANSNALTFDNYVDAICFFLEKANKPTVIIVGVHDSKRYLQRLSFKAKRITLSIHSCNAIALFYKMDVIDVSTSVELLDQISKTYARVGDFCAGYGNTADAFYMNGKNFVVSDVNKSYIGYIIDKYENIS